VIRRRISQPTRLRPADALGEACTAILAKPARALVTSLGTLLGVAWFVTALGLASTAGGQVTSDFAHRLPTHVWISQKRASPAPAAVPYPAGLQQRLRALHGVIAAGVFWPLLLGRPVIVSAQPRPATGRPGGPGGRGGTGGPAGADGGTAGNRVAPGPGTARRAPVIAASPGFLAAASAKLSSGRLLGAWDQAHHAQVCLAGAVVARALGIGDLRQQRAVYIDDVPCVVIGIVSRATGQRSILRSVVLPSATATALWGPPDERAGAMPAVLIRTRPGAAGVVARQAPFVISQDRPDQFLVRVPPGPGQLRDQVVSTLTSLFFVLGWVSLAIGTLSIASVTWLSVRERSAEFGLRRAVGARPRHILAHVICESAILGLIGGLAGASLGVAMIILLARARGWVPVVAPLTVLPAPLGGAAAGMLAGIIPAMFAARIQPAETLSRSLTM
jgi:putative ABC transport system permease protein